MSIDLSAPEVKEAIAAAVADEVKGLKAKNEELVGKLKEANKGRQIDPAQIEKLEQQIEELEGKLKDSEKAIKTATKDAETARKALEASEGFTQRLLVDNGLNDALAKAGVTNPVHLKAVKSMLAGQVQVVAEGDSKVAKVGDKALSEFVAEWAKGDEGKFFVAAPANSGGGALGSTGTPNSKTMTRSQFDAADHSARSAFVRDGGKVVDG